VAENVNGAKQTRAIKMAYFENRQKGAGLPDDRLEEAFKCIAEQFSEKWVQSPRTHVLQQLWSRKDVLATSELYFFGNCLNKMALLDAKWTKQQKKIIKEQQENNIKGAIFEIIGLGMLSSPSQKVIPAKKDNPGFDATLFWDDNRVMRLSLKNHGDSSFFKNFTNEALNFEGKLKVWLDEKKMPPVQVFIEAAKQFPSKENWNALTNYFPFFLENVKAKTAKAFVMPDVWIGACTDLPLGFQEFHPRHCSYTIIIAAPFHKHEEKSLFDKLDEACANLVRYSKIEDEKTINAAFIHLSENASLKKCIDWGSEYFIQYPNKPISCIIFYQPTVATSLDDGSNFVQHAFQMVARETMSKYWRSSNDITIDLPVGVISGIPSGMKLVAEVDGKKEVYDFSDKYAFQRGNHYLVQREESDGKKVGNITRLGSGIFTHSVFEPFPGQGEFILSGRFAPTDKLLIL
jgi:hypothetical protein